MAAFMTHLMTWGVGLGLPEGQGEWVVAGRGDGNRKAGTSPSGSSEVQVKSRLQARLSTRDAGAWSPMSLLRMEPGQVDCSCPCLEAF